MKSVALLLGLMAASALAETEDVLPVPLDPAQPRGAKYLAMSNEVERQAASLEANFVAVRARVHQEIDRRREELLVATEDEIEREEWGRLLDELKEESLRELRTEYDAYREQLYQLRRQGSGQLGEQQALDASTWSAINRFASRHPLELPGVLMAAPEFDLAPMFEGFSAAIYNCRRFEETFAHPITSEPMQRQVLGVVGGRCHYEEQMPADGRMICHYALERLTSIAHYHADPDTYDRLEPVTHNEFIAGQAITMTSWTLDGVPHEHPVDAAMNAGECVITGYVPEESDAATVAGLEDQALPE